MPEDETSDLNKTKIQRLRDQLEASYQETVLLGTTPLNFLKAVDPYMNLVENDKILKRIILAMREDKAMKSIALIQSSVYLKDATSILDQIEEDEVDEYPIYDYEKLKECLEGFRQVKNLTTEDEMGKAKIILTEKTNVGDITSTTSGNGLLAMAELIYPKCLTSIHNFLLSRLSWIEQHGVFSKYFDYDHKRGILYFNEKEIPINMKKVPNNSHYLLSYLFRNNPFEQHFFDELEDEKALLSEKTWKSYYDACIDIQKKVSAATGITDFLDFSTGSGLYVRFNDKYSLGKSQ